MHHCIKTFHLRISFVNLTKPAVLADLATFTEETLLHLLKKPLMENFMLRPNASLNSFRNNVLLYLRHERVKGSSIYCVRKTF